MKTLRLVTYLIAMLITTNGLTQTKQTVTLYLKNNGPTLRHFKFLEKRSGDPFNVFTEYIKPGQTYKVTLRVGTSLALVNQDEIYASMRGLDVTGKPLLTITAADEGRTVDLIEKKK